MSRTSLTLLSAMPSVLNVVGDPVRAAGWHGHTKGLHTVAIRAHNFLGRVAIEGSQALVPTVLDWFPVPYPVGYAVLPYVQYPRALALRSAVLEPRANPNLRQGGETSTWGFSFFVNCLWLRATVTRDYLLPVGLPHYASTVSDSIAWLGSIDSILVNY